MPTWTVTAPETHHVGHARTTAQAWSDAHDAARTVVQNVHIEVLVLDVDGHTSTVRPARSGDPTVDIERTLRILDDGEHALMSAYEHAVEA